MKQENHRNPQRYIRCPKCKSKRLTLREYTRAVSIYTQDERCQLARTQTLRIENEKMYVMAHCTACKHTWRVRGVGSLDYFSYSSGTEKIGFTEHLASMSKILT